jgi:multidrug efflux system outer membrane protein
VASFGETRDLFQRQFLGGVVSKLDSLRAEAALAQAAGRVPDLERQIVAKENELSVLVGRPAGSIPRGGLLAEQAVPPEVPAGVPALLLERRPDLVEAEEALIASNARIGQALADYFPRIGLTALAGSVSTELSDLLHSATDVWSVGGQALGPLFTFGQTTYTWKAAEAANDASRAAYEGAVLNSLREVSDALTAREKLVAVRAEREREVAALRESVEISQQRYLGGLATYLEVLDAQQQLYPAEFALAQTERDQLLAVVALYRALGGGWNAYDAQPELPQPIVP